MIEAADLVLAVGTEFGPTEYDVFGTGMAKFTGCSIRIDIDPQQMARTRFVGLPIVSDSRQALEALLPRLTARRADGPARAAAAREHANEGLPAKYRILSELMDTIRGTLPGVVMVGDSTQPVYAGTVDFAAAAPRRWFCSQPATAPWAMRCRRRWRQGR